MFTDYLKPVSKELQDFAKSCNSFCLGGSLNFEQDVLIDKKTTNNGIDKIAIIGVQETRSKNTQKNYWSGITQKSICVLRRK